MPTTESVIIWSKATQAAHSPAEVELEHTAAWAADLKEF